MTTSIQAALALAGPRVGAWDYKSDDDRRLVIYSVGSGGANAIASDEVAVDEREAMNDRMRAAGIRIGSTHRDQHFVWAMDAEGATIWSDAARVFELPPGASTQIAKVVTFFGPDGLGHRGVRTERSDGTGSVVVDERDPTPGLDPTYGTDQLDRDIEWAFYLGLDLAMWLDVPHYDQLSDHVTNDNLRAVAQGTRALATHVMRAPEDGAFAPIEHTYGAIGDAAGLVLRITPIKGDQRVLELHGTSKRSPTPLMKPLEQGTNAQIAAFLRQVRTPINVMRTLHALVRRSRAVTELAVTVSGPDPIALIRTLATWDGCSGIPEKVVLDSRTERKGSATWLDTVRKARMTARAAWANGASILVRPHDATLALSAKIPGFSLTPSAVLAAFAEVPFEVGVLLSPFLDHFKRYEGPGFGDNHGWLGWGCMFKGAGHERLVSRRWLEFGPWVLHHGANDLSLVQFHDLGASEDQAIEQERPGHQRMGITQTGGFIQTDYVYRHRPEGLYQPADRSLRILINGRSVSPGEMLDAAAYLHYHRNVAEQPISSVRFIYVEGEERARKDLHELWLHGLECWTIDNGAEKRLDSEYQPKPPPPPAWATGVS